jgi:hypothetical protein
MPVQTCGSKATSSTTSPSPYRGHTNRTPPPSTLKLSSNLAELPQHIHKQLLLDIKEGGGIYCTTFNTMAIGSLNSMATLQHSNAGKPKTNTISGRALI